MLETYKDIVFRYHNYSFPRPSSTRYTRPVHFVIALEMMHYLELEIDKLVDVLIDEATNDVMAKSHRAGEWNERWRRGPRNRSNVSTPDPNMLGHSTTPKIYERGKAFDFFINIYISI